MTRGSPRPGKCGSVAALASRARTAARSVPTVNESGMRLRQVNLMHLN